MKAFIPYLNFDGNTREAMTFYQKCLGAGAELNVQTFGEAQGETGPAKDRVMHAQITGGTMNLMASDTQPGMPFIPGNNVWITQDCESAEEIDRLFEAFSEGGKVLMPVATQFWGARFGMLTDKFGIHWMFNCQLQQS